MAEDRSPHKTTPSGSSDLPLTRSLFAVFVAAIGSSSVGYALGYPSSALLDLAGLPGDRAFTRGSTASQLFGALLLVGAIPGSVLGAISSDRVGRKASLLATGILNIIGWLVIFLAQYTGTPSTFKSFLLLGRALTGVSSGALSSLVPVYAAEMSPPKRRGLLGAFYQVSIVIGVFLSYVMGAIPGLLYYHSALVIIVILIIFEILMLIPKESPRWLLMKNHKYAAKKSLLWLFRSEESVSQVIREIQSSLPTKKLAFREKIKMFKRKSVYIPLLLSIAIVFFHQCTGNNVILNYAASIFTTADVKNAEKTAVYAIGAIQVVGTIISAIIVDMTGRKKLLLFGSIGIAISNAALGTHLYIIETAQCDSVGNSSNGTFYIALQLSNDTEIYSDSRCYPSLLSILPIASVMGFGLFYSVGWRALPFIIMGEMFPNSLRSILNGIMVAYLAALAAVMIGGYTAYEQAVYPYTAWWSFAGVAALSIPFILVFLPETKGKSLEEIEKYFHRKKELGGNKADAMLF